MIMRRLTDAFRKQDWFTVAVETLIVVLGVFLGLQVNNWNQARTERAAEQRFLLRLYADTQANITELEDLIALHELRSHILADFEQALLTGGEAPPQASLNGALCRFFVQPGATLQTTTYDELVASGALSVIRDEELRELLSRQQAAQAEAARLDIMTPAIQRAAEPLLDYRRFAIIRDEERAGAYGGVECAFDLEGMRGDARMPSVIAQLNRDQDVTQRFRQTVLDITRSLDARLDELIPPGDRPEMREPSP